MSYLGSCAEVKKMWPGFKDDEYVIQMSSSCDPVRLYCHGMNTATPREYITLPAGPDKNFASFHRGRLLNFETCSGSINPEPKLTANYWGTTRYRKKTVTFLSHTFVMTVSSFSTLLLLAVLVCLFVWYCSSNQLSTQTIADRGDWLWKAENIKDRHNSAAVTQILLLLLLFLTNCYGIK